MKLTSIFAIAGLFVAVMFGCQKGTTEPTQEAPAVDNDVANAIVGALSEDGGGVADQLGDIANIASGSGLKGSSSQFDVPYGTEGSAALDTVYDAATGWWTATLTRTRIGLLSFNFIYRRYQYQFLNKSGQPQRRYIVATPTGPDTAATINFAILQGKGYQRNPWRVHRLDSLAGQWTVTNANKAVFTVNGNYYRSGVDTLRLSDAERTHANTLSATLTNVTRPRYALGGTSDDISGTISGNYTASITFTKGDLYKERQVNRDFTITLSGENAQIGLGGRLYAAGWKNGDFRGMMR